MSENNGITKQALEDALSVAELRIVQFQPPATRIDQNTRNSLPTAAINIPEAQQQMAEKAAKERADALFDVLVQLISQVANDEVSRQQIVQRLSNLDQRVSALEARTPTTGTV
jgi:hypothetical protein